MARKSGKGGGGGKAFLGFVLGAATVAGGGYAWQHYGGSAAKLRKDLPSLPAGFGGDGGKSGDPTMSRPEAATPAPLHAKRTPPFGSSEDVFEGGAHVYRANCASCHGTPGHDSAQGKSMSPVAPQLWKKSKGVGKEDPGDVYGQIAHGVHGSGMPSFAGKLSDTQIWQVTLLLQNAGNELPDPVTNIIEGKK
jgi:mono/diheme cytochrome c family protein